MEDQQFQAQMRMQMQLQRQRQFQAIMAARQEQASREAQARETGASAKAPLVMGGQMAFGRYMDLPLLNHHDLSFVGDTSSFIDGAPAGFAALEDACRNGPLSTVQSVICSEARTPAFLHHCLTIALRAGNVDTTRYLLSSGAPIVRATPDNILSASLDRHIVLFELLSNHGWTPRLPDDYGSRLLRHAVTNVPILRWFLANGSTSNSGPHPPNKAGPHPGAALELAAGNGTVETVRLLLDSGAQIQRCYPLHSAAGAWPPGGNPHVARVNPTREFDTSRIPVMALLVERGADINQMKPPQSGGMVPGYAIIEAVMAGAVERVRWLLEHGADPTRRGPWGSALEYATKMGSDEMKGVVQEAVKTRSWMQE